MKKIIRPRQAGKSSELIRIAEETNAYIIVATRARAVCLADMAQKQGRHILYPVTLQEYEQSRFRGSYIRHVLIDDADAVLEQVFKEVTIDAITITECVMEHDEKILNDAEKKYLSAVIKPFRDKVNFICKVNYYNNPEVDVYKAQHIVIGLNDNSPEVVLPLFKAGTMYKGMEAGHVYILEDLGL